MPGCSCGRWFLPPIPEFCNKCGKALDPDEMERANLILEDPAPVVENIDLTNANPSIEEVDQVTGKVLPPQLHMQNFGKSIKININDPIQFRTPSGKIGVVSYRAKDINSNKNGISNRNWINIVNKNAKNWRDVGKKNVRNWRDIGAEKDGDTTLSPKILK